jgi:uncharacterized membrane protein YbhN (UPF0104 family)
VNLLLLFPIFLLSIVNWGAEVLKWQILSEKVKPISYTESFKVVLSSFAVSTITPNRVGEYGAKIIFYNKSDWKQIVSINFLGNMMQLLVTLLMVVISYFALPENIVALFHKILFLAVLLLVLLLLLFIFKSRFRFFGISEKVELSLWKDVLLTTKLKVLAISLVRYLSFSIQFLLILSVFSNFNSLMFFAVLAVNYLLVSIVPTLFITDLLVKGSISIFLFSFLGVSQITIIAVVLLAWMFNFVVPTIIGTYFLLKKN